MKRILALGALSLIGGAAICLAPADAATGAAAAEAAPAPAKEKGPTIGSVAMDAIRAGQTNQEALETVKAAFPEANTSLSSINWYRNKLRKDGENVKSARELAGDKPKEEKPKAAGKGKGKEKPAEAAPATEEKDPLG